MGRVDFESGIFDPEDYSVELDGLEGPDDANGNGLMLDLSTPLSFFPNFSIIDGLPRDELSDLGSPGVDYLHATAGALRDRILGMDLSSVADRCYLNAIEGRRAELDIDLSEAENPELILGIATNLYHTGQMDLVEELLTVQCENGRCPRWPNDGSAMDLLAEIAYRKKNMLQVIDWLTGKDGVPRFPDNLNAMCRLLEAYKSLGCHDDMIAAVEFINRDGDFLSSHKIIFLYLLALNMKGLHSKVIDVCLDADGKISLSVLDPMILRNIAIAFHKLGKHRQVCAVLLLYTDTEPYRSDPKIISTLTGSLHELHRYQESLDLLVGEDGGCRFPDDPYCVKHFIYCLTYLNRFAEAKGFVAELERSGKLRRWGRYLGGAIKYLDIQLGKERLRSVRAAGLTGRR